MICDFLEGQVLHRSHSQLHSPDAVDILLTSSSLHECARFYWHARNHKQGRTHELPLIGVFFKCSTLLYSDLTLNTPALHSHTLTVNKPLECEELAAKEQLQQHLTLLLRHITRCCAAARRWRRHHETFSRVSKSIKIMERINKNAESYNNTQTHII